MEEHSRFAFRTIIIVGIFTRLRRSQKELYYFLQSIHVFIFYHRVLITGDIGYTNFIKTL